jgi:NADH:ubiquinone oxidoreductase subunit D
MSRSVGFKKDLRLSVANNYSNYNNFTIKSFLGVNGDTYDRYLIRMLEMAESLNIVNLVCYKLNESSYKNKIIYQNLVSKN